MPTYPHGYERCISQRNTHNRHDVLLMGEEFFKVMYSSRCQWGHSPLPLMSFSPLPLDELFKLKFLVCDNLPLVRWFRSIICCLSRVVIGSANLGQCMKFGLILGVMNRSGLRMRV